MIKNNDVMSQSYRAFSLRALSLDIIDFDRHIKECEQIIQINQARIKKRVLTFQLVWFAPICLLASIGLLLIVGNPLLALATFCFLAFISWHITTKTGITDQFIVAGNYKAYYRLINENTLKMGTILRQAKKYQRFHETENGPGFVATYTDILLNEKFPSQFSMDDRMGFTTLSTEGLGQDIETTDYGKVLVELKKNGIQEYVTSDSLIEKVPPQKKHNVAIACCQLLMDEGNRLNQKESQHCALVGLNVWLSSTEQGHYHTLNGRENEHWDLVKTIFKQALSDSSDLRQTIRRFKNLEEKMSAA